MSLNTELKKINQLRDVLVIILISVYIIFGLITVYSIYNNVFSPYILGMRLIASVLILLLYFAALDILKKYEKLVKERYNDNY